MLTWIRFGISVPDFPALKKKYGLHKRASILDLPAKILAELLTTEQLIILIANYWGGNHYEALKIKDKEAFKKIDHEQWDMTLSSLGQTRLCGLGSVDKCPYPLEVNFDFWKKYRTNISLRNLNGKILQTTLLQEI